MTIQPSTGWVLPRPTKDNDNSQNKLLATTPIAVYADSIQQHPALPPILEFLEPDMFTKADVVACSSCGENNPRFEVAFGPIGWQCVDCCELLESLGETGPSPTELPKEKK